MSCLSLQFASNSDSTTPLVDPAPDNWRKTSVQLGTESWISNIPAEISSSIRFDGNLGMEDDRKCLADLEELFVILWSRCSFSTNSRIDMANRWQWLTKWKHRHRPVIIKLKDCRKSLQKVHSAYTWWSNWTISFKKLCDTLLDTPSDTLLLK